MQFLNEDAVKAQLTSKTDRQRAKEAPPDYQEPYYPHHQESIDYSGAWAAGYNAAIAHIQESLQATRLTYADAYKTILAEAGIPFDFVTDADVEFPLRSMSFVGMIVKVVGSKTTMYHAFDKATGLLIAAGSFDNDL